MQSIDKSTEYSESESWWNNFRDNDIDEYHNLRLKVYELVDSSKQKMLDICKELKNIENEYKEEFNKIYEKYLKKKDIINKLYVNNLNELKNEQFKQYINVYEIYQEDINNMCIIFLEKKSKLINELEYYSTFIRYY